MPAIIIAILLIACAVEADEPPSCADVGCPLAPSGSPVQWELCAPDAGACWCGAPEPVECRP